MAENPFVLCCSLPTIAYLLCRQSALLSELNCAHWDSSLSLVAWPWALSLYGWSAWREHSPQSGAQ